MPQAATPANPVPVLTAAQLAQQAAAVLAQPTLPRSLVAMVPRAAAPVPAALGSVLLVAGKPFACRSHNAAWAAALAPVLARGPASVAALAAAAAAAGSPAGGLHSIKAYIKRGNLVPSK